LVSFALAIRRAGVRRSTLQTKKRVLKTDPEGSKGIGGLILGRFEAGKHFGMESVLFSGTTRRGWTRRW
ncbi:hypothetical protein NPN18_26535, partial [Vibrio parahaemolyticus]|nr:hypothetical protein [Vibrio parahaemolyticus]